MVERTRVLVLLPADLASRKIGGIQSFVRDFIKFAPDDFDIEVIGASSDPGTRPIGKWHELVVESKPVRHLAVTAVADSHQRSRVPVVLRYTAGVLRWRSRIPLEGRVRQFHRAGVPLGFMGHIPPAIQVVHLNVADIYAEAGESRWRKLPGLYHRVEALTLRRMGRIFVVNEDGVRFYRRRHPEIAHKVRFMPTWFDDTLFFPRGESDRLELRRELTASLGVEASNKLVLFVGRLERQKHPELLVDTLERLDDQAAHLLIVGDGGLRPSIDERAKARRVADRVHLLGWRPRSDIAALMAAADALLLSSRFEGMPITVLEALACGLPVASTAVGEVPKLVRDGISGWLAQERTPIALAKALEHVLQAGRAALAEGARTAAAPFSSGVVLGGFYQAHREVLSDER